MCLITFHWQPQQTCKLLLAANRDEFYQRQAQPLAAWDDISGVYAGKDLSAGGSWLGVRSYQQNQRFAALTNIRDPQTDQQRGSSPLSRGAIVTDFLSSELSAAEFCQQLAKHHQDYGLFNLICSDGEQLWYCHNHLQFHAQLLTPGFYALSNGHLDSPWPKAELARKQLQLWCADPQDALPTTLLNRREPFADELLPDTGVPQSWEKLLSSQFIHSPVYGTRCSTGLCWNKDTICIEEQTWDRNGTKAEKVLFEISL